MIIDGTLSVSQKERGRKNYNMFNLINGSSYMCLGETVIILFIMNMNCPDYMVSTLGTFFFLGNFAMPLGKMTAAKIGAARCVSLFWTLRSIAAMFVALSSLVYKFRSPGIALFMVMAGAFIFYSCRSGGLVVMQPLVGEITTNENRGRFISDTNRIFYLASLITLAVIILILNFRQDIWTLSTIIFVGSAFGFMSAGFMARIDETMELRKSAKEPILDGARKTLKDTLRRRQLFANLITSAFTAMISPISMLALKRGYGISDENALLFALVQFLGAIIISYLIGALSEETGPRPILLLFYSLLLSVCLAWVFAPLTFKWQFAVIPFFLIGAAGNGILIALMQYFLISIPQKERMAASLTIYVVSGVGGGLLAMFVGGLLIDNLGSIDFRQMFSFLSGTGLGDIFISWFPGTGGDMHHLRVYRLYFAIIGLLGLLGFTPLLRLKRYSRWRVSDVLGLAFAPRDIMTLYNLNKFNELASPSEEENSIGRFHETHSELSEKALLSSLDSPKLALRSRALLAIAEIPLSREGRRALINELEIGEHTTANIAAQICGNQKINKAIPLLRRYLEDTSDYYLKSKAMIALAQLKDTESYPLIRNIFVETSNPRLITHAAAAMVEINNPADFELMIRKTLQEDFTPQALLEVLCAMSELSENGDEFYKVMKLYRKDRSSSIQMLTEICLERYHGKEGCDIAKKLADFDSGTLSAYDIFQWLLSIPTENNINNPVILEAVHTFAKDVTASQKLPQELIFCLFTIIFNDSKK